MLTGWQKQLVSVNEASGRGTEHTTALMYAAQNGHLDTVKFLILAGANPDVKDREGKTALELAGENRHDDVVDYLKSITLLRQPVSSVIQSKR